MSKRNIIYFAALMIACSCSPALLEPAIGEQSMMTEGNNQPSTKSSLEDPGQQADEAMLRHQAQTDHYLILMHHVELRDTVYVQTLTEEDMVNLNITEAERVFSNNYVISLNELMKNQ